ncbi:MAG: cupredoxin domain-containing protein [Dehalococcoidia bacterium]
MYKWFLITVLSIFSLFLFACGSSTDDSETTEATYSKPPTASNQAMESAAKSLGTTVTSSNDSSSSLTGGTRIEIKLRDDKGSGAYAYTPAEFNFKVGEIVNFVMTSETELHTFTVDDLNIDQSVDAGETVEFSFKFDKPGTYQLICIPHETQGMIGKITVK